MNEWPPFERDLRALKCERATLATFEHTSGTIMMPPLTRKERRGFRCTSEGVGSGGAVEAEVRQQARTPRADSSQAMPCVSDPHVGFDAVDHG